MLGFGFLFIFENPWVCFTFFFFSLDWVYNLLFRIDVGLFIFLGGFALLQFIYLFIFSDFSSKIFFGLFFLLFENRTNNFIYLFI